MTPGGARSKAPARPMRRLNRALQANFRPSRRRTPSPAPPRRRYSCPMPANPLVDTDWLADHLGDPSVKVLDATWRMPSDPADPKADFEAVHIPGARFFPIDEI